MKSPVLGDDLKKLYPITLRRPERHRDLRQRARAADDERLLARPRGDDDDPRGVGAAHRDGRAPARLLRVPRGDDGAVGRPGGDGLHRRPPDRRDARPQRPAPGALHRHRRRPGRDGVGDRRAADRREPDRQEVAPAAGQDVPDRLRAGPHRRRRGAEEPVRVGQAVPAVDRQRPHQARGPAASGPAQPTFDETPARSPAGLRLHPGRHQVPDEPDGAGRRGRHRLDGQRLAPGRAVGQEQAALQLLQAAVRAGHEPADRSDPRVDRDVAGLVHRPQARPARHQRGQPADAARGRAADPRLRRHGAAALDRGAHRRQVQELRARHHLSARLGRRRRRGQARVDVRRERRRDPERPQHPDHQRPAHEPRAGRAAGRARALGGAPAPGARGPAHDRRPGRRDRLGARGAPLRRARRLRRRGGPSLPRARDAGRAAAASCRASSAADKAIYNYVKAIGKGLSKIMSKMGVSTYMSYCGAQLFEAVGLEKALVDKYFRGTASQVGGIGVFAVAEEAIRMHRAAFSDDPVLDGMLDAGGEYAWRVRGEEHMWTPDAIAKLQHGVRANRFETYQEYAQAHQRPVAAPHDAARPVRVRRRSGEVDSDRRGRAGGRDRQALRHRRDVARLDLDRGARDARRRDEPDRRQVEHRRGRRGPGALPRRDARRARSPKARTSATSSARATSSPTTR